MGYPTKVQLISRKASEQYYINFPTALAQALEFEKGESVEWIIADKANLILSRAQVPGHPSTVARHVSSETLRMEERAVQPQEKSRKRVALLFDLDLQANAVGQSHLFRIQEAQRQLEARGYETSVYLGNTVLSQDAPRGISCPQFLRDYQAGMFDGVLGLWGHLGEGLTEDLRAKGIPVVGLASFYENAVTYDFASYIRQALQELRRRGRTRIAYIGSMTEWNLNNRDVHLRNLVGKLIQEQGFEVREEWLLHDWHRTVPAAGWSSFREIWTAGKERPDAVILNSLGLWSDIRKAIEAFHLQVPDDLDVVSAVDSTIPISEEWKELIKFQFDSKLMIEKAVDLLAALLAGKMTDGSSMDVDAWSLVRSESVSQEVPNLVCSFIP